MKYKVYTKWIGYSEIEVKAKSEEEAKELVNLGKYEPENELSTGTGLNLGYDEEEVLKVEEIRDDNIQR
tara:strand:- start:172 stop:378 length:207 start_codon:yes stop_codon:yes gene_type:complete